MSNAASRWVTTQTSRTPTERLVLYRIADAYNESWDRAWPSLERLMAETSLGRSTILRTIAALRCDGTLGVERWVMNGGGKQLSNRYLLLPYRPAVRPIGVPVIVHGLLQDQDPADMRRIGSTNLAVEWPPVTSPAPGLDGSRSGT
jgi:hypothetical protein